MNVMKKHSTPTPWLRVRQPRLLVCVKNDGYDASLEVRKIYKALPDSDAAAAGLLRVVDESGESYLYPPAYFAPVQVTPSLRQTLLQRA